MATQVDREEPGPAEIANKERAGLEAVDKINTRLFKNLKQGRKRRKNSKRSNKLRRKRARKSYTKHCNRHKHSYGVMREPHYEFHDTEREDKRNPPRVSHSSEISTNLGNRLLSATDVLWQIAVHLVQNPNWLWKNLGSTTWTPNVNVDGMEIPRPRLQRPNVNMANGLVNININKPMMSKEAEMQSTIYTKIRGNNYVNVSIREDIIQEPNQRHRVIEPEHPQVIAGFNPSEEGNPLVNKVIRNRIEFNPQVPCNRTRPKQRTPRKAQVSESQMSTLYQETIKGNYTLIQLK